MSVVRPILIVDDEPVARESLAAWLREDGYQVETAASGAEALARAKETDYEVYFIDLKMPPGADGIETMKAILCSRPQASIVIITAHATVDTAILAMKEGAQDYLVKGEVDNRLLGVHLFMPLSVRRQSSKLINCWKT